MNGLWVREEERDEKLLVFFGLNVFSPLGPILPSSGWSQEQACQTKSSFTFMPQAVWTLVKTKEAEVVCSREKNSGRFIGRGQSQQTVSFLQRGRANCSTGAEAVLPSVFVKEMLSHHSHILPQVVATWVLSWVTSIWPAMLEISILAPDRSNLLTHNKRKYKQHKGECPQNPQGWQCFHFFFFEDSFILLERHIYGVKDLSSA